MKQLSDATQTETGQHRKTKRQRFLEEMERVTPWAALTRLVESHSLTAGAEDWPGGLDSMLRVYLLQQWFDLADSAMADALVDMPLLRAFARLEPQTGASLPDEQTIRQFRALLETHELAAEILNALGACLAQKGLVLKAGALVDATLRPAALSASPEAPIALSLVVPVFNEAETVEIFINRVSDIFKSESSIDLEIVFVNDGSEDGTLERLLESQRADPRIRIVDLSRNFGKEAALTAGLQAVKGQVVVPIDVDLQDPPELILQMIARWREGYEVVLGRRTNRKSDSWLKRASAIWFYRIHNRIANPKLPENVGDFRLIDRRVVDGLRALPESRRFMKGLFAWVGFRTAYVDYARPERVAGTTKFNGWKLWNFALEGVTSFSTDPLRIWTYVGAMVSFLSLMFAAFIALTVLIRGIDVPGYASLIVAVTFLGGLQLIGIGIVGEYLGRTYIESKRRPIYVTRRIYESKN